MFKKICFLILILFVLTPLLVNAGTLSVKGKNGYNLSIVILDPSNNDSIGTLTGDIGSSGQVNIDFSASKNLVHLITIARLNGKIAKKLESINVNTLSASPIIIDLTDPPPAPPLTPPPAPTPPPEPAPAPVPEPTPASETTPDKKPFFSSLTGFAITEAGTLNPNFKKILIYSGIGLGSLIILAIIIFGIFFFLKRRKKNDFKDFKDFKVIKYHPVEQEQKEPDTEEIKEAEKRLKIAQEEIEQINKILDKRKAIKDAERKLNEDRKALERIKRSSR